MDNNVTPIRPIEKTGAQCLQEAADFIRDFCVLPSPAFADLLAVWAAHTHVHMAFSHTPRIAFISVEPASGKSRALNLIALLSRDPKTLSSFTDAVLARWLARDRTMFLDETDMIFRSTQSAPRMQALLNDGFRHGGTADKCSGGQVEEAPIFRPVALAGLRDLPHATASRTIIVYMRPRRPDQPIRRFLSRSHEPWGESIGEALGIWAKNNALELADAWPDLPDDMEDREADVWSPLFAVAEVAGGDWPARIRHACMEVRRGVAAEPVASPLLALLTDIRRVWTAADGDIIPSQTLCARLLALSDAPWVRRWPKKETASTELAAMLRGADIAPMKLRLDSKRTVRGYERAAFDAVWASLEEPDGSEENPEQAEQAS